MTDESAAGILPVLGVLLVVVLLLVGVTAGFGPIGPLDGSQSQSLQQDDRTPDIPCQGDEELLAKYNWEQSDGTYQFVLDDGADVVTFEIVALDDDDPASVRSR